MSRREEIEKRHANAHLYPELGRSPCYMADIGYLLKELKQVNEILVDKLKQVDILLDRLALADAVCEAVTDDNVGASHLLDALEQWQESRRA